VGVGKVGDDSLEQCEKNQADTPEHSGGAAEGHTSLETLDSIQLISALKVLLED
jgi:hypothetical protein